MIYVCIPNYTVNESVSKLAVNSIMSFKRTADCIVVVADDCSQKDTTEIETSCDVFLRRKKNGGFSAACNTAFRYALKQADCEYVVCANTDIEVPDGWVGEFRKMYDFGADLVGGLGYRERGAFHERSSAHYYSEGGRMDDWLFPGGFWSMKREVLDTIGLLDEGFKHGGMEDIDFFYRAKQAGLKLFMTPKVWYWHQEGATRYSPEERGKQRIAFQENIEYFKEKHGFCGFTDLNKILVDNRVNL